MKRFHVHLHVADLAHSVRFYSALFGSAPTREESDYAKWMLDDPKLNFAISARGGAVGIDHLGFQVDTAEELPALRERAASADALAPAGLLDEGATSCCYARSEKHWVTDPQGVAWEQFHTLHDIPRFSDTRPAAATGADASACCAPQPQTVALPARIPVRAKGSNCC